MPSKDNIPGVYQTFRPPAGTDVPLVLDSPHSGRDYPADFRHTCPVEALRAAEDNEIDQLFDFAPEQGAAFLCALFPRTYIDVNRAEDDIDSALLSADWPGVLAPTARSHAGIGLIRRLVRPGVPVYERALAPAEIQGRIENYYRPYHAALKNLLDETHYRFGRVFHMNCHSMPAPAARVPHGLLAREPDFVLGDRDGTSCEPGFTDFLRDTLRGMGYRVAINTPYKGVEIVRRSANPGAGFHSLQMEISKGLYWNENKSERNSNFNKLKSDLYRLVQSISAYATSRLAGLAAD